MGFVQRQYPVGHHYHKITSTAKINFCRSKAESDMTAGTLMVMEMPSKVCHLFVDRNDIYTGKGSFHGMMICHREAEDSSFAIPCYRLRRQQAACFSVGATHCFVNSQQPTKKALFAFETYTTAHTSMSSPWSVCDELLFIFCR